MAFSSPVGLGGVPVPVVVVDDDGVGVSVELEVWRSAFFKRASESRDSVAASWASVAAISDSRVAMDLDLGIGLGFLFTLTFIFSAGSTLNGSGPWQGSTGA